MKPSPLKLLFVGDVMLGRLVNEVLKGKPPAYPWGDTLSLLRDTDVRICNLECVLSDWGTPWSATPKVFHFRSDAKNVQTLTTAHIDAVSLANNHVLDFEYEGLFHMMNTLQEAGIHYAGAGATLREASAPAIWSVNGKTIGLLAFTDNEPAWSATDEQPGVWYVPIELHEKRAEQLFEVVRRTKEDVDILVVSAHWGPNWGYNPPAEHLPFARALIDAGADVIVTACPFCMVNIEDAIKVSGQEGNITAIDLAELVDQHIIREIPQAVGQDSSILIHA